MIEKLTNREYLSMKEDFENEKLFTTKSLVESNGESSWSGIEHGGRRPSANINASEFGQENRNVSGVDSDKVRGRRTENYSNRSNESYSEDKQNVKKFSKSIDSEGNTLTEAQAQYFKDSKVRDENGNLLVVYHGTEEKFFTFDIGKGGKNGRALGYGFYFTPDKTMAESFGDNIIKSYLNVKRFMSNDKKTIKKTEFKNFVKTLLEKDLETYSDEGITWQDSFLSNYFYTYDYSKKDAINKFVDIVWNENNNDIDLLFEVAIADGLNSSTQGARRFYDVLKESTGYDGIMQGNEIVVFNSNQIKSIDNINPTDDKDIRYSKSSNAIYTEKQYNDYGWARADDILLMNENEVLKKKALKDDRIKLSNNEYAIVVGKKYGIGNKVVITNSSKTNPKILRVIAVNIDGADFDVESYLPELRRYIYDQEQDRDRLWTSYEVLNLYAEAEVLRSYSKEDCPSYSEYRKSRQNNKGTFPNGRENERKRIIKFSKSIDQRYLELAKNLEVNREEL